MRQLRFLTTTAASALVCAHVLSAPAAWAAAPPRAEVRGIDDKALRLEIEQAVGAAPPATSRLEARRRSQIAADDAVAVLRSEGYYDATVTPDISDGDSPQPFVAVTLGVRTHIVDPSIEWVDQPPDAQSQALARAALKLKPDDPARALDVIAAEGRAVAALQNQGYADAASEKREVVVDHADNTMRPVFRIRSGPLVRLAGIQLEGPRGRTRRSWLMRQAPWKSGQVYRPALVAELERRLRDTGVYDSVTVSLAPVAQDIHGLRPVIVSLTERSKGLLELGASYSTSEGAGVDSRWLRYNRLGLGDTLTTILRVAQIDSRLQTELSLPNWRKPNETLKLTTALYRDDTPAYNLIGAGLSADLTHRYGKTSFLTYGLSFDESQTDEKESTNYVSGRHLRLLSTFGALAAFNIDRSNDPLNPTSGWRLSARAEPKTNIGDGAITYLKASAQGSVYLPLFSAGTVLAGRIKLGSIFGGDIPGVPAFDRFYAGGGGSVRGFSYQAVGPRYSDNTPEGGVSLFEESVELRQRVVGNWGVVAFVDAGTVAEHVSPSFDHPEIGAGLGVRYNLGFGPIRLDMATPLTRRSGDPSVQVYLSIGQSF